MAIDELIGRLEMLSPTELLRVKGAVDRHLAAKLGENERGIFERLEREGLLTRPRGGEGYDPGRHPPVEIEGEPLSETLLRERR